MTEKILALVKKGYEIDFRPDWLPSVLKITVRKGEFSMTRLISLDVTPASEKFIEDYILSMIDLLEAEVAKFAE